MYDDLERDPKIKKLFFSLKSINISQHIYYYMLNYTYNSIEYENY